MKKNIAIAAACAALCSVASAADVYVGAGIGQSRAGIDCSGAVSCDKSDTAFKLYGGLNLAPNLGVELAHVNFGKVKAVDPDIGNIEYKATGLALLGVARYDIKPGMSLVGRLGFANVKTEGSATALNVSISSTKTKPYYGVGFDYEIQKNVALTAFLEFTRGTIEAGGESDSANLRVLGAALQYKF